MFASTAFPRIPLFGSQPAADDAAHDATHDVNCAKTDKPPVVSFDALVRAAEAPCCTETTRRNAASIARYENMAASLDADAREFLAALVFLGTRGDS